MYKILVGLIGWRERSTVYIGWIIWSISRTESREDKHEHKGFFSVAIKHEGYEATYLTRGGVVSLETLGINKGKYFH